MISRERSRDSFKISSIVGEPACRNTSMMSSSADPARRKGGTNEIAPTSASRLPTGLTINRARDEACRHDFVSFIRIVFDLLTPRRTIVHELAYSRLWHITSSRYVLVG